MICSTDDPLIFVMLISHICNADIAFEANWMLVTSILFIDPTGSDHTILGSRRKALIGPLYHKMQMGNKWDHLEFILCSGVKSFVL